MKDQVADEATQLQAWETPELVQSDVNAVTLAAGGLGSDGASEAS